MARKKKSTRELIKGHEQVMNKLKSQFNDDELTYETFKENYEAHQKAIDSLNEELINETESILFKE